MKSSSEIVLVIVQFIKKGDIFCYDDAELCLKSPIDNFSEERKDISKSERNNCIATEDNIFFIIETIPQIEPYSLRDDLDNIGKEELFKDLYGDFEKIALKLMKNKKDSFVDCLFLQKTENISPEENFIGFYAIIQTDYISHNNYHNDDDDWDIELKLLGIIDNDDLMKKSISLQEFLKDDKIKSKLISEPDCAIDVFEVNIPKNLKDGLIVKTGTTI